METFIITVENETKIFHSANKAAAHKSMLENMGARLVDYGRKSSGNYYWYYRW